MSSPQSFSHYPAWPAPVRVPLVTIQDQSCVYLPGRNTRTRMILVQRIPAEMYHQFMDAGFRRSGRLIYQPVCDGCRQCIPIRVPVQRFQPTKSQRRSIRRNADVIVSVGQPEPTDEKFDLYRRYQRDWHARSQAEPHADPRQDFESFLYDSPIDTTIEFSYRDPSGRLLAVGLCDLSPALSLSSVYCYFDPEFSNRGLGTYSALEEIRYAKIQHIPYYYLGYWINGCSTMSYKSRFQPNEVLHTDGTWREPSPDVTCGVTSHKICAD